MSTGVFDSALLKNLWSTEEMREIFSDNIRIQMWLDYEAALAIEQAELGIIPSEAADEIVACANVECLDMDYILEQVRLTKHPLVPTIRGLEHACAKGFGEYVHFGPTTQDVMDTGMMLQFKMAHNVFLRELKSIGRALLTLSETHRNTPMAGRTLALQAIPITFGHKSAIWLAEITRHYERLVQLEPRFFVGSVVGAVGSKASFGERADELERRVLSRLGLNVPEISWQPARDRFCEYGMVLGMIGATLGKIANEILLLAHNELDEVAEPFAKGQVGSSTMPHKRNPATTENAACVSNTLKGNVSLLLDLMKHQHERDGAIWKMEWKVLPEICLMLSIILDNMKFTLSGLVVNKNKMRSNLDLLGGFMLAERVMFILSEKAGKQTAHELIYEAAMQGLEGGTTFAHALTENPRIMAILSQSELNAALDPTTYIGNAPEQVDQVIAQVNAKGWLN
ncbi:adenylosuccinate lyase [Edwardsiella ictaluri]|uniref:Adenylosuccinate lyase, putative n=3 Tax=Edwardsiella ictaluri TaxID=67780 RepID=C5BE78_EDWI9|nr:adenylosuccinate lyase [Edwardsiella ictaluri]ACR69319.1 adenylosuccinate lyase, putative [Edwardsiella ictaluri 93-146]ARD38551.1 adenylosuccinate lyase [Edwardsiella ictaluri]AVZ83632.1 adenylosuccinate lyase [Edwardsiella ictaluri]EKS7764667.1 adenylosuccinate lyase [Edwardsiella ictaluri]EKS7771585.1 adenylosuccinate lyase [Edwardsiella ictaluri]